MSKYSDITILMSVSMTNVMSIIANNINNINININTIIILIY